MDEYQREEQLKQIKQELLNASSSPLFLYRQENNYWPVIGEGSHESRIMFIGEAPGKNEAKTGRPFCGSAGKILDDLLASIGLKREEVYITNIVKDRPPENRDPLPEEINFYGPYLDRQIELIQPKIIATLGRYSMKYLLRKFNCPEEAETIGNLHGKPISVRADYGTIVLLPLYHPAAAIYNQKLKKSLLADFSFLKNV